MKKATTPPKKNELKQPVKHLLVDLDGTLLGNQGFQLSVDFVKQALAALRAHGSIKTIAKALIDVKKEFDRPSRSHTNDHRVVEKFAQHLKITPEEARKILRENALLIFPNLKKHFYPIDGAKDFLDWAKDQYPLTLATNPVWPPEIVELRVQWAGIDPKIFGSMTHVRKMHACKPASEYYEEILEQQGLKAEDCLLIGDDLKMDLPATRVGIPVFIVGKFAKQAELKHSKAKAPAWRGSYKHLRAMLEQNSADRS